MFHRTSFFDSFFLSSWQLIFAISMCLRFVYGWNSEETLEKTIYIYIFISRIQWRTRSIFKDKPSFATVDRNLQSLAFHAWNFIFSRVYASAIYIYINIFPREENTSDGIRIPPPNNLPPRNRYSKIIFIIREFLLRCETAITSEKKKTYYYWGRSVLFPANALLLLLIENVWKRKKKKKKNGKDKFWIARGDGIWYS